MWIKLKSGKLLNMTNCSKIYCDNNAQRKQYRISYVSMESDVEMFDDESKRDERFNEIQKLLGL